MNIEFLVITYFVSMFVDWVFQTQQQAINKSNWSKGNRINAFDALFRHSLIYSFCTMFITRLLLTACGQEPQIEPYFMFLVTSVLFVSHMIIDSRIPVKWIMRFKGLSKEQINDYQNYGFLHIGIDHRLHELVILTLAFFV